MALWDRFKQGVSGRGSRTPGESDSPGDPAVAGTRATGGVAGEDAENPNASTGTTDNETFVGRASGDEVGDVQESGAEKRAEWEKQGRPDGGPRED